MTIAQTLEKDKKNVTATNKFSSVSKNPVVGNSANNNLQPPNTKPTIMNNTLNSKNELRNTKSQMKTNGTGFSILGSIEALGSKILGPKISVIKR